LDSEYLIIWEGFPNKPWKYEEEFGLRQFLLSRIAEGYSFPLNPVWPVRDKGWYEVYEALKANTTERHFTFDCWYPPGSGIHEKIEAIHDEIPFGFVPSKSLSYFSEHPGEDEDETTDDDAAELRSILSGSDLDHDELGDLVSHCVTDVRLSSLSKGSHSSSGGGTPQRSGGSVPRRLSSARPKNGKSIGQKNPKSHGVVSASFRRMSSAAVEMMAETSSALNEFTHGLHEFGHEIARGLRPNKHASSPSGVCQMQRM